MLQLFSKYGTVTGFSLSRPACRSGFVSYAYKHQAAHALQTLHAQPCTLLQGTVLSLHHACISSSHMNASSNSAPLTPPPPPSITAALLSSLRLYPNVLSATSLSTLSSMYEAAHFHKGEMHWGRALPEEDDRFGLPPPKSLPTSLQQLLESIYTHITEMRIDTQQPLQKDEVSTKSPQAPSSSSSLYHPTSGPLPVSSSTTPAAPPPVFNRISAVMLHPGAGIKPTFHAPHVYHGDLALLPLHGHTLLDLYQPYQMDRPLTSILIPASTLLYIPASVSQHLLYAIAYRTRDVLNGVKTKRSPMVLNILRTVLDSATTTTAPAINKVEEKEEEKKVLLRPSVRQQQEDKKQPLISCPLPAALRTISPALLEQQHVVQVYETIATHFSSTRHSPWPRVEAYVRSIPAHSYVLDIACGNGKYMGINPDIHMIGCDVSIQLIRICRQKGYEVCVADCLALPWSCDTFDSAICIALLHHLSTVERRVLALQEMLRVVKKKGKILLSAWAQEQDTTSRRRFEQQDVLVPWKLPATHHTSSSSSSSNSDSSSDSISSSTEQQVVNRYCHVYVEGEIEGLLAQVGGNRIIEQYYDRGNWVVLFEKA